MTPFAFSNPSVKGESVGRRGSHALQLYSENHGELVCKDQGDRVESGLAF